MSTRGYAATPHKDLIAELMNPNNPKNEREHAAVREIERLQEALANTFAAIDAASVALADYDDKAEI